MREMKDSGIEWIGKIPGNWNYIRLKDCYYFEKGKNSALYTQEYIGRNEGKYPVYSGQTENEGIMGKINTFDYDIDECLFTTTVGAKAMTPKFLKGKFSLSQNCLIMLPKRLNNNKFVYYILEALFDYEKLLIPSYMQPSLRVEDLKGYTFYAPELREQSQIADLLDRKCSEIDSLTSDIEEQIETLKQYKKSVITEAVTKGLDPNAEMKDSGVEWIGEIPVEWNLQKVKTIFYVIGGCGFKDIYQGEETGDYPFMKASDINGSGKYVTTAVNYVSQELATQEHYNIIPKNSIVMAKIGEALKKNHRHINTVDCIVDNNCQAISLLDDSLNIDFYYYLMLCVNMRWFDNGGTIPCVNNRAFLNSFIPVPTNVEQYEIVTFLDRKCTEIDSIIADKQSQLDTLAEYKKSLIYEYVTGKKEVPSA